MCSDLWTTAPRAGKVSVYVWVGGCVGVCEKEGEIWVKETITKSCPLQIYETLLTFLKC